VPCLRRLVVGLLPKTSGFGPRLLRVRAVETIMALEEISPRVLWLRPDSTTVPMFHTHILLIYHRRYMTLVIKSVVKYHSHHPPPLQNQKCEKPSSLTLSNTPILEIFALLGCYAALSGSSVPTFRDNLSVQSSRVFLGFLTLEDRTDRLS
jgi:hypothetical protein